MNDHHPSRRQFVQLASGLALTLAHGLRPSSARAAAVQSALQSPHLPAAASLRDSLLLLEFDAQLNTRVSRVPPQGSASPYGTTPLTHWGASDYVMLDSGTHITRFHLQRQQQHALAGPRGPATQLTLVGLSSEGIEKTVELTLFQRFRGFVVYNVSYRNLSRATVALRAWTNGDFLVNQIPVADTAAPAFWSYSGSSYGDRRDWVQPVAAGFTQDNFMGMSASDYGGGTPIVDVWRRDCGLAIGHVETTPKLVSLPVQEQHGRVRMAVCCREKISLEPGASFQTLQTFIAVHEGDYFATLNTYRHIMGERGLTPPSCGPACYEPIWCAWGYERNCTTQLIEDTLPKVKELGLEWVVIDDGWQTAIGDWTLNKLKYPSGEQDMHGLITRIKAAGLKPRLWYSPLAVAPGSDELHDHTDMLLLDKDGAPQLISWWNSLYLCPAYAGTLDHTKALVKRFLGKWGFAGLKIDGQHLNGVAPCFNPAHDHVRPEESIEGLQNFFHEIYRTAMEINPNAVIELCPCGTAYSIYNFPSMNQAPASDPESSWQVRLKGKTLKALMGPSAPFAGDHVELSDHGDDFASTVGIGGIISTKFTWPVDPKPKDSFLLTPVKEREWRHWISLYKERMLSQGVYNGYLYDIGFDKPEAHVVEQNTHIYYAFYAKTWAGQIELRGLGPGQYQVRDYVHDRDHGTLSATHNRLHVTFDQYLLLEAVPA